MTPDFRDLEIFYWVASLGGFRRASERLRTTQPAVSLRIAGLEAKLGVRLIERHPKGLSLTPKGRELLAYAQQILRLHSDMLSAVAAPASMGGLVRLGVAETIVHTWLSTYIERVHAVYPLVSLDIEVDVTPRLREGLVENQIDLAFLMGPVSEPRMINFDLCRYKLAFIGRRALDLGPEPVPLAKLLALPIITYPKTTKPYIVLRQLLNRPDLRAARIYSNSSLSTIVRMTLDGIGVSVIPPAVIGRELEAGVLKIIETELPLPDLIFTATFQTAPDKNVTELLAQMALQIAAAAPET